MKSLVPRGRPAAVWIRIAAAVGLLLVGFDLLQSPARSLEARAYSGLLRLLGFHGVSVVIGSSVYLIPAHRPPFFVTLTPSCSSLAPVLTLACLAAMLPRAPHTTARSLLAYLAAAGAIVLGNLIRIDASIVAGLRYGESVLVLFHDSAGTIFAFAYTLGGFVLMLWLQLPDLGAAGRSETALPADALTSDTT